MYVTFSLFKKPVQTIDEHYTDRTFSGDERTLSYTLTITRDIHIYFISVNIVLCLIDRYDVRNLHDYRNLLHTYVVVTIKK